MREEDKKAFVNDYLELCRKYGICITSWNAPEHELIIDSYESEGYDNIIKEIVQ